MPPTAACIKTEEILGLKLVSCDFNMFISALDERIRSDVSSTTVFPVPVNVIIKSKRDAGFRTILDNATFLVPDGMPVLWVGRLFGRHIAEKISGSDLFPRLCQTAAEKGHSIYLFGGKPGSAEKTGEILKRSYPSLKIAGSYSPPFGFDANISEDRKAVDMIKQAKPSMLFVGLGAPKQEKWIWKHKEELKVPLSMAVGGTFELFSGSVPRAPVGFQKRGFEWLWRLTMEPRRLWWRYTSDGFMLIYYVVVAGIKQGAVALRASAERQFVVSFQCAERVFRLMRHPPRLMNMLKLRIMPEAERVSCKPRHIVFYVTDRCNLKCAWCLSNTPTDGFAKHKAARDLDIDTFKRIIVNCPTVEAISFTGQGEPLMNRDLPKMMEYATGADMNIFLTTNGILLDDILIEKILSSNVLRVNISLKGMDGREFAAVTQEKEELFYRQVENARKLIRARSAARKSMAVRLSYVVGRRNYRNMETVMELAAEIGADELLFDNIIPYADIGDDRDRFFEDDDEVKRYIKTLSKRNGRLKVIFPVLLKRNKFTFYCPGYYEILDADAEGNIAGCMRVLTPESGYGNILNDKDFMNSEHFRMTRKMFIDRKLPARCRYCVEMSCAKNARAGKFATVNTQTRGQ